MRTAFHIRSQGAAARAAFTMIELVVAVMLLQEVL